MKKKPLSYSKAGVSIHRGDRFVDLIGPYARKTLRPEVLGNIGGFAAFTRIPRKYRDPILVSGTDGVGTKVLLARDAGVLSTIGIDLVAMCANDVLTTGAEPLFFLDYFATSRLEPARHAEVVKGVSIGCRLAGCALVGGETAEMPQVYRKGDLDLAGFCVGIAERSKIIDGRAIKPGDVILAFPSSGPHSNGYSLIRAVVRNSRLNILKSASELGSGSLAKILLRPTRIYAKEILKLAKKVRIKGMAHITGGGIEGNLPRVFPPGTCANVNKRAWRVPKIFKYLQEKGNISEAEMFRTFNMGIGYCVILSLADSQKAKRLYPELLDIGRIEKGRGEPHVVYSSVL